MISPILQEHFERFRASYPEAHISELRGTDAVVVEVPDVPLPPGWNRGSTTIKFVVPRAYPNAPPDCFWTDSGLALDGGREPQGTRSQPLPGQSEPLRWFSWHVQQWNPNAHTLASFFQVVLGRFRKLV